MTDRVDEEAQADGLSQADGLGGGKDHSPAWSLKDETLTEEQAALRDGYYVPARVGWTDDEFKRYAKIWRKWEKGRRLLDGTDVPVLEIWGDRGMGERPGRDRLQIPEKANVEMVWLPRCGHSMLVQQPRRIGELMADFVERTGRRG